MSKRRLRCAVPFCRRTRGDRNGDPLVPHMEWICGPHWRLVDRKLKRMRSAARRRWKARDHARWDWLDWRLWQRMKRQAIERAMGVA